MFFNFQKFLPIAFYCKQGGQITKAMLDEI